MFVVRRHVHSITFNYLNYPSAISNTLSYLYYTHKLYSHLIVYNTLRCYSIIFNNRYTLRRV